MGDAAIAAAADALGRARRVVVSTGAGMSAESGVPTFRDAQTGLWAKYRPEHLATPEAFARDPKFVWGWYRWRRELLRAVEPHEGHRVLAQWESRFDDFVIVTQNVDGLHHRAGSARVVELHGRLDVTRCTSCAASVIGLDDLGEEPRCGVCGAWMRPGVVWFGEALPAGALEQAFAAAEACDVMLVVGTSGVVQPAASLGEAARRAGATVIEINPHATPVSGAAQICVRDRCGAALRAIDERLAARS